MDMWGSAPAVALKGSHTQEEPDPETQVVFLCRFTWSVHLLESSHVKWKLLTHDESFAQSHLLRLFKHDSYEY